LFSFVTISIRWLNGVITKGIAPTNCDHKRITSVTFQAQCVLDATHRCNKRATVWHCSNTRSGVGGILLLCTLHLNIF